MKTMIEIFNSTMSRPMSLLRGLDLYAVVAKEYYNLPCEIKEVRQLYPQEHTNVKLAIYSEIYK